MSSRYRWRALVALVMALGLIAAACSSDDDGGGDSSAHDRGPGADGVRHRCDGRLDQDRRRRGRPRWSARRRHLASCCADHRQPLDPRDVVLRRLERGRGHQRPHGRAGGAHVGPHQPGDARTSSAPTPPSTTSCSRSPSRAASTTRPSTACSLPGMLTYFGEFAAQASHDTELLITIPPPVETGASAGATAAIDSGIVATGDVVGILAGNGPDQVAASAAAKQVLEDGGYTVSAVEINTLQGDVGAINQETGAAAGTFKAAGVTNVMIVLPFTNQAGFYDAAGTDFTITVLDTASANCTPFGASRAASRRPRRHLHHGLGQPEHGRRRGPDRDRRSSRSAELTSTRSSPRSSRRPSSPGVPSGQVIDHRRRHAAQLRLRRLRLHPGQHHEGVARPVVASTSPASRPTRPRWRLGDVPDRPGLRREGQPGRGQDLRLRLRPLGRADRGHRGDAEERRPAPTTAARHR